MVGDPDTMMSSPGMSEGYGQTAGDQTVNPQDQVRGAVERVSKLRQSARADLEALSTQFPSASKAAKDLMGAFDQGLQGLIRELIKTVRTPEAQAPVAAR